MSVFPTDERLKRTVFRLRGSLGRGISVLGAAYYALAKRAGWHHASRFRHWWPYVNARLALWLHGVRLDVTGTENLDLATPTPRVLMCNHNSRLDGYILLAACPMAFKSFWSNDNHVSRENYRWLMWAAKTFDLFFVHDKFDQRHTFREFERATKWVAENNTISFFPEGTYSHDGKMGRFGPACATLALRAGAVVHPVLIHGSAEHFERTSAGSKRGAVRVEFLPSHSTKTLTRADRDALTAQIVSDLDRRLAQVSELAGKAGSEVASKAGCEVGAGT